MLKTISWSEHDQFVETMRISERIPSHKRTKSPHNSRLLPVSPAVGSRSCKHGCHLPWDFAV